MWFDITILAQRSASGKRLGRRTSPWAFGAAEPIAYSIVELLAIDGTTLQVRGLDCLNRTPLIDLKPERGAVSD
jgi:tRNA (adenine37-N6)-methyltransferase